VRPFPSALANVGVAALMFVVGLELDRKLLQDNGRTAFAVPSLSILLPFELGVALYPRNGMTGGLGFVLFIGAAMSITAFPVPALLLAVRGLNKTRLGALAGLRGGG
jgi:Kef-type K+ transport system membrane component KefB